MGNPILSDASVGFRIVQRMKKCLAGQYSNLSFAESHVAGPDLVKLMEGFKKVLIIDAMVSGKCNPGEVSRYLPEDYPLTYHLTAVEGMSFEVTLRFAALMGSTLPKEIVIFAVEVVNMTTFGYELTPAVEIKIPEICARIVCEIKEELDA